MIPHRLNLLSPQKKQHLKRMVNFQFIKGILELILIALSIIGIALLGGQWVLQNHFNAVAGHIVSVSNQYGEVNQEIKQVNLRLIKTDKIQQEYTLWTPLITELSSAIPDGILINKFSFNYQNKSLNLSGTAKTRNDLLNLQRLLEKIDWIEKIDIPPEQLTEKENVQFDIRPVLK